MLLESGLLREEETHYVLTGPLASVPIPTTLHDALMARLDRLAAAKAVAQLGAVLGREFAYAVAPGPGAPGRGHPPGAARTVGGGRAALSTGPTAARHLPVQACLDPGRGLCSRCSRAPASRCTSRWPRCWRRSFPRRSRRSPSCVAHHYTEAGLTEQAIPYWQRAGQQALQRSANLEAIQHLTTGLELLATLPETPARAQQELDLLTALGPALMATKGSAAPEVEQTYARARALCAQVGETPQLFPTLRGLCRFYHNRGALPTARELGEQLYRLAQRAAAPTPCLEAHEALGDTLFFLGEYAPAWTHLEQGIALTDLAAQQTLALRHDVAPGVRCLAVAALTRWCLGYPDASRTAQSGGAGHGPGADPSPELWRSPSTGRPICITVAARRRRCRCRPRPS